MEGRTPLVRPAARKYRAAAAKKLWASIRAYNCVESKQSMKQRSSQAQLPKVSEQMKAWSSALESEVADWPHASTRSFFGFTAVYRKDKIFAALPRTRAWGSANSLAFKLPTANAGIQSRLENDPRVGYTLMAKTRWFTFELSSDADLPRPSIGSARPTPRRARRQTRRWPRRMRRRNPGNSALPELSLRHVRVAWSKPKPLRSLP